MNNYTVVANGLFADKIVPKENKEKLGLSRRDLEQAIEVSFDSNVRPSREFRIMTGPEGARQFEQAVRAELGRQLTQSELIQQLDNLSREENV